MSGVFSAVTNPWDALKSQRPLHAAASLRRTLATSKRCACRPQPVRPLIRNIADARRAKRIKSGVAIGPPIIAASLVRPVGGEGCSASFTPEFRMASDARLTDGVCGSVHFRTLAVEVGPILERFAYRQQRVLRERISYQLNRHRQPTGKSTRQRQRRHSA